MRIDLAAYGWDGPAWSTFYPPDLPPAWRLDYYCNEFDSVVVPAADWAVTSIDEAADWLAEAPEGFRFYWELDSTEGATRLLELAAKHGEADSLLAGWVFESGLMLEHKLFEALSACLPGAAYGLRPVGSIQAEQLAAQGITLCWQEALTLNCRGRGLRVLQISKQPDLRALRTIVEEQCAAAVENLLLMVEPNPQTVPALRDLQIFARLYNG